MPGYKIIEVYTSEGAKWRRRPVYSALVGCVNSRKIAACTIVAGGMEGSYEDGEIAAGDFSCKKPVHITIIRAANHCDEVLSKVREMAPEGIGTASDVEVLVRRSHGILHVQNDRVEKPAAPTPRRWLPAGVGENY